MELYFAIMFLLVMFIAIPARIFIEVGLDPEEMTIIPFLLVWIAVFLIIRFAVKMIMRGIKFMLRNKKGHKRMFV